MLPYYHKETEPQGMCELMLASSYRHTCSTTPHPKASPIRKGGGVVEAGLPHWPESERW